MSKIINLGEQSGILSQYVAELRDEEVQQDKQRFRLNVARISEIMAYEISKQLKYNTLKVTTPLGSLDMQVLAKQPVLVSILRAALAMHDGFVRIFDDADSAFISAYRRHTRGNKFVIEIEYMSAPAVDDRPVIMLDPMVATGSSMHLSYQELLRNGTPEQVFVAAVIASREGLDYLERHMPEATIYVCAIDEELTAKSYIVPGLGDAGDLAYGSKQ